MINVGMLVTEVISITYTGWSPTLSPPLTTLLSHMIFWKEILTVIPNKDFYRTQPLFEDTFSSDEDSSSLETDVCPYSRTSSSGFLAPSNWFIIHGSRKRDNLTSSNVTMVKPVSENVPGLCFLASRMVTVWFSPFSLMSAWTKIVCLAAVISLIRAHGQNWVRMNSGPRKCQTYTWRWLQYFQNGLPAENSWLSVPFLMKGRFASISVLSGR